MGFQRGGQEVSTPLVTCRVEEEPQPGAPGVGSLTAPLLGFPAHVVRAEQEPALLRNAGAPGWEGFGRWGPPAVPPAPIF